MNLEDQVCSLELSRKLKEIGVNKASALTWINLVHEYDISKTINRVIQSEYVGLRQYGISIIGYAYTASELMEMLPWEIKDPCIKPYGYEKKLRLDLSGYSMTGYNNNKINFILDSNFRKFYTDGSFISRRHSVEEDNLCNALAKMLIYLIENKLMEVPK